MNPWPELPSNWEKLLTFLPLHLTCDGFAITVTQEAHGFLCEVQLSSHPTYVAIGATAADAFNGALCEAYRQLEIP